MGNINIVRVSNIESPVKSALLAQLNSLFKQSEHKEIAKRNNFVYFDHATTDGKSLSLCADARVIWGGDETVNAIRKLEIKPRCRDISFADRYSACLIHGDKLENPSQCKTLAKSFVKDIEPFSQQACSSPKVVFWLGSEKMQSYFFEEVDSLLSESEQNQRANQLAVTQYFQALGVAETATMYKKLAVQPIHHIKEEIIEGHIGQAFCVIKAIGSVDELPTLLDEKMQTLSYWGVSEEALLKLIQNPSIKGLDRIVPVGKSLDFAENWDGYQLLTQLSRIVTVEVQ
jgi:hypothetical protein